MYALVRDVSHRCVFEAVSLAKGTTTNDEFIPSYITAEIVWVCRLSRFWALQFLPGRWSTRCRIRPLG